MKIRRFVIMQQAIPSAIRSINTFMQFKAFSVPVNNPCFELETQAHFVALFNRHHSNVDIVTINCLFNDTLLPAMDEVKSILLLHRADKDYLSTVEDGLISSRDLALELIGFPQDFLGQLWVTQLQKWGF